MLRGRRQETNEEDLINYLKNSHKESNIKGTNDYNIAQSQPSFTQFQDTIRRKVKTRKAPGINKANNELLKQGEMNFLRELEKPFDIVMCQGKIPQCWKLGVTIPNLEEKR